MALTDELCRSFLDLWWHFDPAAASAAGAPGEDGRLGRYDGASIREQVAALRSIAGAVEDLELDEIADEIDRTALLDHLRVLLFRLEQEKPHRRDPVFWLDHACRALDALLARRDPALAAPALARLRELPRYLGAARDTLREPPLLLIDAALLLVPELTALVEATVARFGPSWEANEEGDRDRAVAAARLEVERFGSALRSGIAASEAPGAEAVGEEEVDRRLHHEHASVHNGAEVWRLANRVASELGKDGEDWGSAGKTGEDGASGLEDARQAADAAGFGSFTPPSLEIEEVPGYVRVLEPLPSYRPAGAGRPAAILATPVADGLMPWFAARLGVPGLHLQQSRRDALPGLVRRHIASSSTVLGWSIYASEVAGDYGLGGDPGRRDAARLLALRDAHLAVADLGIHTRQFGAGEAISYLATRLPLGRAIAEADVRRLVCRPTSAAAALLGKRELLRLAGDVRNARGSSFVLDEFHDELLGYGGLPVPLIRWGMGLDE